MNSGDIALRGVPLPDILQQLRQGQFETATALGIADEGHESGDRQQFDYLLRLPLHRLTSENVHRLHQVCVSCEQMDGFQIDGKHRCGVKGWNEGAWWGIGYCLTPPPVWGYCFNHYSNCSIIFINRVSMLIAVPTSLQEVEGAQEQVAVLEVRPLSSVYAVWQRMVRGCSI